MPTPTYTQLNSITLAASASSITISGIPQGYKDFILVSSAQGSTGGYFRIYLNSDTTASNYSRVIVYYEGSLGAVAVANSSDTGVAKNSTEFAINTWQFMDATSTDKHKNIIGRQGSAYGSQVYMDCIRWANISPITSIQLSLNSGTISTGSTFTLYGIVG